ncbi:MAG: DNA helicase RecQ [Spirochaetaceae bacterium]|jgi:ATP-dependent DNA helicase RecQ|nr:DNA helicase RecQ [Spirochaetaceae bacterium]
MADKYSTLKDVFGYGSFRSGQEEVIDALLGGRDVLAVMPTGAGKSLCYQIPALLADGISIIVSPLISLMKDQVQALRENEVSAAFINSSLSAGEYSRTMRLARSGGFKMLYIAPERLAREGEGASWLEGLDVSFVVVDEAHCVSHWGHDFRTSYMLIAPFIESLPRRPVVATFTATATPRVKADIAAALALRNPFHITTGFDRPNLFFSVEKPDSKTRALKKHLRRLQNKSGIVYCSTRRNVEDVCASLIADGFSATRYHAGLAPEERKGSQDDFIYDRRTVMVATNAFGMGIDKSNVSFVIHYNMPKNIESYYQEAGRAGRDGSGAECILFYSYEDVKMNEFLIEKSAEESGSRELKEYNLELLKQITFYATGTDCLRGRLLSYFGETPPNYCGACSNCLTGFESVDITVDAQKIVSCVYRLKQRGRRFGKSMIVQILRGSRSSKILNEKFETLSVWGIMKDRSERVIRGVIEFLVLNGYLAASGGEFPSVIETERSGEVIFDKKPLMMMLPKGDAASAAASGGGVLSAPADGGLLAKLKALRTELAAAARVPAYIIFSDAALLAMCGKLPVTRADFLEIPGVGAVKAEKYGEAFTGLIREHAGTVNN